MRYEQLSVNELTVNTVIATEETVGTLNLTTLVPAAPLALPAYAVAGLPAAASYTNCVVYCTNGAAGNPCLAISDGTNWLRCDTLAAVAAA